MGSFKKEYRNLEMRVHNELRDRINNSDRKSKFHDGKAIFARLNECNELTIINDQLQFVDSNGHNYSIYAEATLEDLIDILILHDFTTN